MTAAAAASAASRGITLSIPCSCSSLWRRSAQEAALLAKPLSTYFCLHLLEDITFISIPFYDFGVSVSMVYMSKDHLLANWSMAA